YYRLPKKLDWIKARSKCEKCNHQLTWYENIPVFSYLFLRGKCSQCGKKISSFYFWWELLGGFFFLWLIYFSSLHLLSFWQALLLFLFGESLLFVALIDWQKRYITNKWLKRLFILSVIFLGLNFFTVNFSWFVLEERVLMALIWGGFFWLIDFKSVNHYFSARLMSICSKPS
ncbi:MAG: prepilin peptidase, partial [Candidatus Moranbacteria bacterium]|nr:prepilin peptidase [Candidatus Moranbacteria bacterium]